VIWQPALYGAGSVSVSASLNRQLFAMKSRRVQLEEFLAQDPGDSFSRYALALELEKEGQAEEAVNQLKQVASADPSYVAAFYHLGRLLVAAGSIDEAREVYKRGLVAANEARDQRSRSEIQEAIDSLT
jgi:thioredoxin-like negative regulator of GroEL